MVPSVFILTLVFSCVSPERKTYRVSLVGLKAVLFGVLAGFVSAFLWLSWNETSGMLGAFKYGAPACYPRWQIVCCGLTVILLSVLILIKYTHGFPGAVGVAVSVSAGFSTAFSLDASMIDATSQEGVGVAFSYIGIGLMCLIVNTLC